MMERIDIATSAGVRAFAGVPARTRDRTTVTRWTGIGSPDAGTDRFPPVDEVLAERQLFDRLSAVA